MLKLYFAPHTCALAPHIALIDAGAAHEAIFVSFKKDEQRKPDYLAVNPKARVPSLVTHRGILTETPAILAFIAQTWPQAGLAPTEPFAFAQAQAFNSYLCSTLHVAHAHRMRGYRWADEQSSFADMQRKVPQTVAESFSLIERTMFKGPWVLGDTYSICDPYLFTLAQWMEGDGVDPAMFPNVADHRRRMGERASVRQALDIQLVPTHCGCRFMTQALTHYLHHRIDCEPLAWQAVAKVLAAKAPAIEAANGLLYGIWRSQIGQPRDTLNAITAWHQEKNGWTAVMDLIKAIDGVRAHDVTAMTPTLRPLDDAPPRRQGNFAFRWFETPANNWNEFLDLCADAWPGFESSYDSQVIGLWKVEDSRSDVVRSLLMTRRPDLAMWERSKIPQGEKENAVREKLSRRYDLCTSTCVYTTTLLTAEDRQDTARWT